MTLAASVSSVSVLRRGGTRRTQCRAAGGSRRGMSASSPMSKSLRATAGPQGSGGSEVVPSPDYRIGATLVVTAVALASQQKFAAAVPIGILGAFLTVQTSRVKFLFGEDALEVVIGEEKKSSGENAFVGGENKWKYDSFINVREENTHTHTHMRMRVSPIAYGI